MRFAAIGLDHRHIYDLTEGLLDAGATCAGYWPQTTDPRVLDGVRKRFADIPAVEDRDALMRDPSIDVIVSAAVPRDRTSNCRRRLVCARPAPADGGERRRLLTAQKQTKRVPIFRD
jgi:hypothetical protein